MMYTIKPYQATSLKRRAGTSQHGFALIVIAALFTGAAVIGTAMLDKSTVTQQVRNQQEGQTQINKLASVLTEYAMYHGRLPCPARFDVPVENGNFGTEVDDCATATAMSGITILKMPQANGGDVDSEIIRGIVPIAALASYGLTVDDAFDASGNRIMYVVNRKLTHKDNKSVHNIATDHATITDKGTGRTTQADFLLISYGRDKLGGIPRSSAHVAIRCSGTNLNAENCDDDINFIKQPHYTSDRATESSYFDDDIASASVTCSNGALNRSGDGQCSNTYCWGDNSYGQLGNGTVLASSVPVPVKLPAKVLSFQSVSVNATPTNSYAAACAISSTFTTEGVLLPYGDVYCWGKNQEDPSGNTVPTKISGDQFPGNFKATSVQVGDSSACAMGGTVNNEVLTPTGKVYCWGRNNWGQLGNTLTGQPQDSFTEPKEVRVPSWYSPQPFFTSVSGDGQHWCAAGDNGQVYCWGLNDHSGNYSNPTDNLLGYINTMLAPSEAAPGTKFFPTAAPAANTTISNLSDTLASIGGKGSTATSGTGKLIGWGTQWSRYGGVVSGNSFGSYTPDPIGSLVDTSGTHQCLSDSSSILYCKGTNDKGQLGNNTTTNNTSFVAVNGGKKFSALSLGGKNSCGLSFDGKAYCWGDNSKGQLGNTTIPTTGTSNYASTPTPVTMPTWVNSFTSISAGGNTTCATTMVQ